MPLHSNGLLHTSSETLTVVRYEHIGGNHRIDAQAQRHALPCDSEALFRLLMISNIRSTSPFSAYSLF